MIGLSATRSLERGSGMRKDEFRARLLRGETQIGLWSNGALEFLEIGAIHGADYVLLDMEHAPNTITDAQAVLRTADAHDLPVLVRLPHLEPHLAGSVLDAGAIGYIVPHVQTASAAAEAVAFAKYSPDGTRSMCPYTRGSRYVGFEGWDEFWPAQNASTVVGVIVEDALGLENLEEICAVDGVDLVWLGYGDLAQSLGLGGDVQHELIVQARQRGLELCQQYGKSAFCGLPATDGQAAFELSFQQGFRTFAWGDIYLFTDAWTRLSGHARNFGRLAGAEVPAAR
jgi:2-keto-3-deoxy-L-rhamnonate aldolase RhmA